LLGEDPPAIPSKPASSATYQAIRQVISYHAKYWKSLQLFAETFMGSGSRGTYNFELASSPASPIKDEKPSFDWTLKPEPKVMFKDLHLIFNKPIDYCY
jgi:hypothetical protein